MHSIVRLAECVEIEIRRWERPGRPNVLLQYTGPFQIARRVTILPNLEISVSVTTINAGIIIIAPHQNVMWNWMVFSALDLENVQPNDFIRRERLFETNKSSKCNDHHR